jgi:molybdopterin molybdotransferase
MTTVAEAEKIIMQEVTGYGTEALRFQQALGRVLAENIVADRDIPASNRATMDGIAINYKSLESGVNSFTVRATQAAGDTPAELTNENECIEIMTGASLSGSANTVVRYEDLDIKDGVAALKINNIKQGQNIHKKGIDRKQGDIVVPANTLITADVISAAAFTGYTTLTVKKNPRVIVFSNGDELMDVADNPPPHKIRRTNSYTIAAALQELQIHADIMHLPDDAAVIKAQLRESLSNYDVIIACGGVSMGKYDYVAQALENLSVKKLFHKVQQRPGKPFWFGTHGQGTKVFAFPGNPVSAFMCLHRYFIPWHKACMGMTTNSWYASLNEDVQFEPALQYFLPVRLHMDATAQLLATPVKGNGSGDLMNLADTHAFMELPLEHNNFKKGDIYRVWPFKPIFN